MFFNSKDGIAAGWLALQSIVFSMQETERWTASCWAAQRAGMPHTCCPRACAGTLTQNNMVVSKLWLAGHLLPDLKPYTRREPHRQGSTSTTAGLAKLALAAAGGGGGGGPGGAAATAATPPLAELVRSTVSGASLGGSGSVDEANAALVAPQASLVEPNAAGSAAPADVTRLLVESISLNSTANIYSDTDGGRCCLPRTCPPLLVPAVPVAAPRCFLHRIGMPCSAAAAARPKAFRRAEQRGSVGVPGRAGQERRTGNRTEIALLDLARLLGAKPRSLRRQQRQLAQVRGPGSLACQGVTCRKVGAGQRQLPVVTCLCILQRRFPRLQIPFSSERKRMTTASLPPGYE